MYKLILIGIFSLFILAACEGEYQLDPYTKLVQSKLDPTICHEFLFEQVLAEPTPN